MPQARTAQQKSPILKNLTGGLNVRDSITDIADNEAAAASNVIFYTSGALSRRGGWSKLIANSPTTSPLLGTYQATFNSSGTYTRYLVVTDGSKMWQTDNPTAATVTWTEITGSATLDATQPYKFGMMTNRMLVFNGKCVYYWSGSGNLVAFPTASYVLVVQDLIYSAVNASVSVAYTSGATAGAEVVSVVGNAISVQIENGVSTAAQIKTAVEASGPAMALLSSVVVNGSSTNPQNTASAATVSQTRACPVSNMGINWQNYWFWGGDSTNPSRLYFSDLGTPLIYPSANYIDVPNPFDGDPITGLAILYGNLLVFKRYSYYVLQGAPPSNLILSKLNSSVGCLNPESVVQIDNLVFFVSDKGLYAANLFNVVQKCYKVEPRYLEAAANHSAANPIWAVNYKQRGQIFISCNCRTLYNSAGSTNDRIICHDYFNADANGDPTVSEFIVGHTEFSLESAKPNYATGPSIMADYLTSAGKATVISTFYDKWVYIFTEGSLATGGPQDEIAALSGPTYPQTDFLSKFYDWGDPNMIKQARWLWTTGGIYNEINLSAGVIYNNSPTVSSFIDYTVDTIELQSASGQNWSVGVDNDGVLKATPTTDSLYLTTLILQDANGVNWAISIDDDGAFRTSTTSGTPNNHSPILQSLNGRQYQLSVDVDGALKTMLATAPGVVAIKPGVRVAVAPLVNGLPGITQGKFMQVYFTGIGVLEQHSWDLIFKGRRA